MRDLVVFAGMLLLVPIALRSSAVAYLLWGWASLVAMHAFTYGFMKTVPYVQIFALIWLLSFLFRRETRNLRYPVGATTVLFVAMAVHATFVASMAYPNLPRNWVAYSELLKTLLFILVMPLVLINRTRMHAMIAAIVIAMTLHGALEGAKFLISGGGHTARGTFKGDNNYFAMLMAMVVPLAIYLWRYSAVRLVRIGFVVAAVLTAASVIATHSRGGLAALAAMMVWMTLLSKRRAAGLLMMVVMAVLAISFAPDRWSDRMKTIGDAKQDDSFMQRVAAWKKSTAIAVEHPFVGGGFFAVQSEGTYIKYRNEPGLMGFIETPDPGMFAAHSIYFQILGDSGFLGLFIYLGIVVATGVNWLYIRRRARVSPGTLLWASDLADLLAAAVIAFLLGGALLSAAYYDLPLMLFGLMQALRHCVDRTAPPESNRRYF